MLPIEFETESTSSDRPIFRWNTPILNSHMKCEYRVLKSDNASKKVVFRVDNDLALLRLSNDEGCLIMDVTPVIASARCGIHCHDSISNRSGVHWHWRFIKKFKSLRIFKSWNNASCYFSRTIRFMHFPAWSFLFVVTQGFWRPAGPQVWREKV